MPIHLSQDQIRISGATSGQVLTYDSVLSAFTPTTFVFSGAPSEHTHEISDINGLQSLLDGKSIMYVSGTTALSGIPQELRHTGMQVIVRGTDGYNSRYELKPDGTFQTSIAFGQGSTATGAYSVAEGYYTQATGSASHAEGLTSQAQGQYSHAEGSATKSIGANSHAEGGSTEATGVNSHAEGSSTKAIGNQSHSEGQFTSAGGVASHTGGKGYSATKPVSASGDASFNHSKVTSGYTGSGAAADSSAILGGYDHQILSGATRSVILGGSGITATQADTVYVPNIVVGGTLKDASGNTIGGGHSIVYVADTAAMNAIPAVMRHTGMQVIVANEGTRFELKPDGSFQSSFSFGLQNIIDGTSAFAAGEGNTVVSDWAVGLGYTNEASGMASFAAGGFNIASGLVAVSLGNSNQSIGDISTTFGDNAIASGNTSTSMGSTTVAGGDYSFAGGKGDSERVKALGKTSFNYSEVTSVATNVVGASADNSSILGGVNNNVESSATRSAVIGGQNIRATLPDHVYVPNLHIVNTPIYPNNAITKGYLDAQKGNANGVASLDSGGKIPSTQLPDSIVGQVVYKGTYNASGGGVPAVASASTGFYYVISVNGTIGGVDYKVGDWIISDGTQWSKVDNTDAVSTVFGRMGNVIANAGDYNASQITNTPAGNIAATTVQAALNELDTEKASVASLGSYLPLAGGTLTGNLFIQSQGNSVWGINGLASGHTTSFQYGGDNYNSIDNSFGNPTIFKSFYGTVFRANNGQDIMRVGQFGGDRSVKFFNDVNVDGALKKSGTDVSLVGHTHAYSALTGIPSSFTPSAHNHDSDYLRLTGGSLSGALSAPTSTFTNYLNLKTNGDYAGLNYMTNTGANKATIEYNQASNRLDFYTNNGSWLNTMSMTTTNGGSVGIGTINPGSKFVVANGINTAGLEVAPTTDWLNIYSYARDAANTSTMKGMKFDATKFCFSSGYVGIGTASPSAPLHIQQAEAFIRLQANGGRFFDIQSSSASDFRIGDGTAGAVRLLINSSGNVGIGGTNPQATLDVVRGTATDGALKVGGTNFNCHFNYGTTEDTYIRGGKTNSKVLINEGPGMGNVGIGTDSPTYKLDVNGSFAVRGSSYIYDTSLCAYESSTDKYLKFQTFDGIGRLTMLTATQLNIQEFGGATTFGGSITAAGDITSNSDARLKDNVVEITGALEKVNQLRGVSYTRNDLNDKPEIGFIAQEVKEVLPEVVHYNEATDIHSLDYGKMNAVLLQAMKEQQLMIQELRSELNELKNQLSK